MRANRPKLCVDFGELPRQDPSRDWPPVRGENFRESVVSPGWEGVSDAKWKELFANRTFHASDYQAESSDRVARRTAPPPYVPVIETPFPGACASMNKWSDDPSERAENNEMVVNCIKDNNFMLNCGINWDRVSPDGEIGRSLRTFQQFRTDDITADGHMIFPPTSVKFVNNMHRKYIKKLVTNFRKGLKFVNSLNTNADQTPVQDC